MPSSLGWVVLVVQNNSVPFDRRVWKEAKSLAARGWQIVVICPRTSMDSGRHEVIDGIEIVRYDAPVSDGTLASYVGEFAVSVAKICARALELMATRDVKVVHVANPPDFFWPLALVCKLLGVKFVYDQHDLAPEMLGIKFGPGLLAKFMEVNEKLSVWAADLIVVVNETFLERSLMKWRCTMKQYAIVYNGPGVDFHLVRNDELHRKFAAKHVIVYVGLMSVNDTVEVLLDVVSLLRQKRPTADFAVVLVGGGDVLPKLMDRARDLELNNIAHFTGIVAFEKVLEYLELADVCVAPDMPNGLNESLTLIKILEYMRAARPFVCFDLLETRRIADGAGLFAGSVEAFAEHLNVLLNNPQLRISLGETGAQIVENRLMWHHSEEALYRGYDRMFAPRGDTGMTNE